MQDEREKAMMTTEELMQKIRDANSSFYDAATQLLLSNVEGAKKWAREADKTWKEIAAAKKENPDLPIYWMGNMPVFGSDPESRYGNEKAQLEVEVYRKGIRLVVGDQDWLRKVLSDDGIEFTKEMKDCLTEKGKTTSAFTFAVGNGESVIYSRERMEIPVLAHELTHAARTMLADVGVDDDEAFAYTVEHLLGQAMLCAGVVRSPSFSDGNRRTSLS